MVSKKARAEGGRSAGTKKARLILQLGIYNLLTNISEGTAFLFQGLTNNETLRLENKRMAYNMILC